MKRPDMNRNLLVLCATLFANVFVNYMWYPLLPLYYRSLGANDWEVGISFTLMGIARTLFAIFGGALADRYGRKRLLVIPALAQVPLFFMAGIAGNWVILLVIFVSANALNALGIPAFFALIAESSSEQRLARSYSFSEFSVLAGLIGGPLAGAALVGTLTIPTLIIINAAVLALSSSVRGWGIREAHHRVAEAAMPKLRAALDSNVRWFLIMGTLVTIAFSIPFGPYFAILAKDAWHNSEAEINVLFAAGNMASMTGIFLGRLSDRWGARRVFVLGIFGFGISVMAWGIAPMWQWGLVPLLTAFGFSEGAFIAQQTLQAQITLRETRTSVYGIITTITGVIGGLGPSLGAWLIVLGGNSLPFIAAGAAGLLAAAAVSPIQRRRQGVGAASQRPRPAQAE